MGADNIISAFTEDQVQRLTGVSVRQLRYWDSTGFFKPALGSDSRRDAFSRIYSFRDITALRVLNVLRNQYSVPLQHLRKVAIDLAQFTDAKWTTFEMFVLNRRVVFAEPETDAYREIVSKQYVLGLPLRVVVADTKRDIEALKERKAEQVGKFQRARNVSHNRLVIAGTRIPVETIKRFAEDGFSVEHIRREYPSLTEADIKAAIAYDGDGMAA